MDKTEKALMGSIGKWRRIEDGKGKDDGMKNCPLCAAFYDREKDSCGKCPVRKAVAAECCEATPYQSFKDGERYGAFHWNALSRKYVVQDRFGTEVQSSVAIRLARAERMFLEGLLRKHRADKKRAAAAKRRAER